MRKALISALMMTLLVLPGCGGREERMETGFETLRQAVTMAEQVETHVELAANYGGTVSAYTLAVTYDGQKTVIEVLAPEMIAGIRASAQKGETTVAYENVILGAGPLDEEGLTPMSALPVMLEAIASGYVELLWMEGDYIAARLYVGETSVLTLWIDSQTLTPVSGEIASDGVTVVSCQFTDWKIT